MGVVIIGVLAFSVPAMAASVFVKYTPQFGETKGEGFLGWSNPELNYSADYYPKMKNKKFRKLLTGESTLKDDQDGKKIAESGANIAMIGKKYAYTSTWTEVVAPAPQLSDKDYTEDPFGFSKDSYNRVYKLNLKNGKYDVIYKEKTASYDDQMEVRGSDGDLLILLKNNFRFEGEGNNICDHGYGLDSFFALNVKDKNPKLVPYKIPEDFKEAEALATKKCLAKLKAECESTGGTLGSAGAMFEEVGSVTTCYGGD